ncbi:winged helix-turn-helix transcriptional regulator [Gordonia soli]|nr:helix-turn-helix domain-containing protein [Gordonia soli]
MARRLPPYTCGLDAAADVIGSKWKPGILWALSTGTQRYGELKRLVPGITEKMLIQSLRELEADGVVHREIYPEVPPRVEYSLSPNGRELYAALEPLGAWGTRYIDHITEVHGREAYVPH